MNTSDIKDKIVEIIKEQPIDKGGYMNMKYCKKHNEMYSAWAGCWKCALEKNKKNNIQTPQLYDHCKNIIK